MKVRKKAKIRKRYNQVPNLTQDTVWESDKKKTGKNHAQDSQMVSPFPTGDHKAARLQETDIGIASKKITGRLISNKSSYLHEILTQIYVFCYYLQFFISTLKSS